MQQILFVLFLLVIEAILGVTACSRGGDSGSSGDAGTDTDTNADTDAGIDAGIDTDCGTTDAVCCEAVPNCAEDHMSVTTDGTDCWCYESCDLAMCEDTIEAWEFDVACQDVGGGLGACIAGEDLVTEQECGEVGDNCTTPSGYTDGVCLSDGTIELCLKACTPIADTGCDIVHTCVPLNSTSTGGFAGAACIPNS